MESKVISISALIRLNRSIVTLLSILRLYCTFSIKEMHYHYLNSIGIVAPAGLALHCDQIQWNVRRFRIAVVAQNRNSHPSNLFRHGMLLNMALNLFPNFRWVICHCLATSWTTDGLHNLHLVHNALAVRMNIVAAPQYHYRSTRGKHVLETNGTVVLHCAGNAYVIATE